MSFQHDMRDLWWQVLMTVGLPALLVAAMVIGILIYHQVLEDALRPLDIFLAPAKGVQ